MRTMKAGSCPVCGVDDISELDGGGRLVSEPGTVASQAYRRASSASRGDHWQIDRVRKTKYARFITLFRPQNRYVGIDFGIGRYQPHSAAEVLANQYGDCKDKDTLLEALLQAKGFSTAPALIGAGIAPIPDVPSPAVFNHVITTVKLPEGRIWLDSTPTAAPFRYLSAEIRDQKALLVPAEGPATLESTPADAPYAFTARFEASGKLDAEGKLTAKMKASYRDDDEVLVRVLARSAAPAERDKVSQYRLVLLWFRRHDQQYCVQPMPRTPHSQSK